MKDRVDLINQIIKKKAVTNYLEIGVFGGECLFNVIAPKKVAVDPDFSFGVKHKAVNFFKNNNYRNTYHEVTSDTFFETNTQVFDLIFIDGLHTWQQLLIDIENSLKYISPTGIILMHDCLPISKWEATPAKSYDDFKKVKPHEVSPLWCGDGWKILFDIKRQITAFDLKVINLDHGIGVIQFGGKGVEPILNLITDKTDAYDYDNHFEKYKGIIEILNPQSFIESV
jgi:hypothetical protein